VPDLRLTSKPLLGALAAAVAALVPAPASAFSPFLVVPDPAVAEASPAYRYANMTDAEAVAELDRRSILYSRVDVAPGVRAPIRLTGRLHGVYVHSALPPDQRVVSPFEILDARLALSLDDFCALLARHDVDEIVHFTMYRPNVAPPGQGPPHGLPDEAAAPAPAGGAPSGARPRPPRPAASLGAKGTLSPKVLGRATESAQRNKNDGGAPKPEPGVVVAPPTKKRAKGPTGTPAPTRVARRDPVATGLHQTTWAPPGTRHPAGLAIDVGLLHLRSGRWISVQHDFHGHIGQRTCGEGAPVPESPDARELRALVCESAALGIFTYLLTPDYNAAHADHFHMEIKPGVRWFLYH
jgi:hypothetical protein